MKKLFTLCIGILFLSSSVLEARLPENEKDGIFKNPSLQQKSFAPAGPNPTPIQSKYDVLFYHISLNAERDSLFISGSTKIKLKVLASVLDTFSFHLHRNYTIDSALLDGKKALVSADKSGHERFIISTQKSENTLVDIEIFYQGESSSSDGLLSGIAHSTSMDGVLWTLSESRHAYTWFPVKQDIADKADSAYIYITTSKENKVASNGLLKNVLDIGNNKVQYRWQTNYPTAYYLLAFSVAKYDDFSFYCKLADGDSILIQNYLYADESGQGPEALRKEILRTDTIMKALIDYYGPYPFAKEKYGHAMAPISGGMEHQTMSLMGITGDWILAHELAHQWYGDQVSCKTWNDIWISEGFATYGEVIMTEATLGKEKAKDYIATKMKSVIGGGTAGSIYVPDSLLDDDNRIFSTILSYNKGGALVHMLRQKLNNDDVFKQILKGFQIAYAGKAASGDDFIKFFNQEAQVDYTDFFNQWYYGEGYPKIDVEAYRYADTANHKLNLLITQTPSTKNAPLFVMDVELYIKYKDGTDTTISYLHNQAVIELELPSDKRIRSILIDPEYKLLSKNFLRFVQLIDNEDIPEIKVACYPNPCKDKLNLQFNENGEKEISLYNMYGKLVFHTQSSESFLQIPSENLAQGAYILRIIQGNKINTRKIIKQ